MYNYSYSRSYLVIISLQAFSTTGWIWQIVIMLFPDAVFEWTTEKILIL